MISFKAIFEQVLDDTGAAGKKFEEYFKRAAKLLGLDFDDNGSSGKNSGAWDIHPKGDGWDRIVSDKDVNIKVSGTKWMFSSSELIKLLPFEELPDNYDEEKYKKILKKTLKRLGITDTVYLKPKDSSIQTDIIKAVDDKDMDALEKLFSKKNFLQNKLGSSYDVRILNDGKRITSIAVDKDGKVFMRSEKPRKINGTLTVTFRTPTPKINKKENKVII